MTTPPTPRSDPTTDRQKELFQTMDLILTSLDAQFMKPDEVALWLTVNHELLSTISKETYETLGIVYIPVPESDNYLIRAYWTQQ